MSFYVNKNGEGKLSENKFKELVSLLNSSYEIDYRKNIEWNYVSKKERKNLRSFFKPSSSRKNLYFPLLIGDIKGLIKLNRRNLTLSYYSDYDLVHYDIEYSETYTSLIKFLEKLPEGNEDYCVSSYEDGEGEHILTFYGNCPFKDTLQYKYMCKMDDLSSKLKFYFRSDLTSKDTYYFLDVYEKASTMCKEYINKINGENIYNLEKTVLEFNNNVNCNLDEDDILFLHFSVSSDVKRFKKNIFKNDLALLERTVDLCDQCFIDSCKECKIY